MTPVQRLSLRAGCYCPTLCPWSVRARRSFRRMPGSSPTSVGSVGYEFRAHSSPPCISVQFRAPSGANRVAGAVLDRAAARWHVARKRHDRYGWDLRFFRAGQLRAGTLIRTSELRNRCRSPLLASNADSLVVELGPPTVFPTLKIELPPPSVLAELRDRLREGPPLVLTTPAETYGDAGGAAGTQLHPEARPC